jgi:glycerophosphoryl diester phosphodiesterase
MRADRAAAISAHRGGGEQAAAGTYAAYEFALAAGADYLELDARRTSDGTLVACHRGRLGWGRAVTRLAYPELCRLAGYEVPRLARVLPLLAGRAGLHLDVKDPGSAAQAAEQALGGLGPDGVVLTTREQAVARMLARRFPDLQIGLAVGGDLVESARFLAGRALRRGRSRLDPVTATGASWAALHYRQAAAGLVARCRERGIRTLVWTVNDDRALSRWLACRDVDVVVTDRPARAVAVRDEPANRAAGPYPAVRPGPPDGRPGPAPGRAR